MSKENEVQLIADTTSAIALDKLPNLDELEVAPIELVGEYWSPETVGESKRVVFNDFSTQTVIENATGESRDMNIVRFLECANGEWRLIRNGSARLVGQFEQMARDLKKGDAFLITYLGKKKTTTGKLADSWSVKGLYKKQ